MPGRGMDGPRVKETSRLHFLFRWPATPLAVGAARRTVEVMPLMLDVARLDELRLLISEVVTNAILHGRVDSDDTVEMRTEITADSVRVEVEDRGRGFDPQPEPHPRDVGGLGMVILNRMSRRWGVDRNLEFVVWFETNGGYRWSDDADASPL